MCPRECRSYNIYYHAGPSSVSLFSVPGICEARATQNVCFAPFIQIKDIELHVSYSTLVTLHSVTLLYCIDECRQIECGLKTVKTVVIPTPPLPPLTRKYILYMILYSTCNLSIIEVHIFNGGKEAGKPYIHFMIPTLKHFHFLCDTI